MNNKKSFLEVKISILLSKNNYRSIMEFFIYYNKYYFSDIVFIYSGNISFTKIKLRFYNKLKYGFPLEKFAISNEFWIQLSIIIEFQIF